MRKLVHVVPDLVVNGVMTFVRDLALSLDRQYSHTLLYETPIDTVDTEVVEYVVSAGLDVLQCDLIEPTDLLPYDLVILYNVHDRHDLASIRPTIYYSYGVNDMEVGRDVTIFCSEYAQRKLGAKNCAPACVRPPMLRTHKLRESVPVDQSKAYTVGILSSGADNKYPGSAVVKLLDRLPGDTNIFLSTLPTYKHPGVQLAIDNRKAEFGDRLGLCPVRPSGGIRYAAEVDVLIHATDEAYDEPYGRLVYEAMAMGKPVVCERRGAPAEVLTHGVNAMMFDTIDEAIAHVERLQFDTKLYHALRNRGRAFAFTQDAVAHLPALKETLDGIR